MEVIRNLLMLDSKTESNLCFYTPERHNVIKNVLNYGNYNSRLYGGVNQQPLYKTLYVLSDEKILEGDWYICVSSMYPKKCVKRNGNQHSSWLEDNLGNQDEVKFCKKIIISSDETLGLPTILPDFLTEFVEYYNKGHLIKKVLVSYSDLNIEQYRDFVKLVARVKPEVIYKETYQELVTLDNYGFIKPAKEEWKRDELSFMKGTSGNHLEWIYHRLIETHGENPDYDYMIKLKEIADWVKTNL